jgi:uncharacterized protein YciI
MTLQQTQSGDYLVLAKDAAEVEDELMRLVSAHWDYMDRFAPQLVARGPLLSSDGQRHMGSVHIITSASPLDAQRFAKEEPYYRANLYASVTVIRFKNLIRQTMWERAPSVPPEHSTFMRANWPIRPCTAKQIERLQTAGSADKSWVFLGLLLSTDDKCTGIAAAADLKTEDAESRLRELLELSELYSDSIELSRWQRGGRQKLS